MALETAMRQSELLGPKWKDVDLGRKVAHLEDTKNGERRDVPLSSGAVDVLKAIPRSADANGSSACGLSPVQLAESHGFRSHELNRLRAMVIEHRTTFLEAWHVHFGD